MVNLKLIKYKIKYFYHKPDTVKKITNLYKNNENAIEKLKETKKICEGCQGLLDYVTEKIDNALTTGEICQDKIEQCLYNLKHNLYAQIYDSNEEMMKQQNKFNIQFNEVYHEMKLLGDAFKRSEKAK